MSTPTLTGTPPRPSLFSRAITSNVRLSKWTERRLKLKTDKTLWNSFESQSVELIRACPDGGTILDLGGGRRCIYAPAVSPAGRVRLVAVDISAEELAANEDVVETIEANIATGIPVPDHSVDLVLSRALLEHVDGVPAAVTEMGRILKPGGVTLHLIPCRYSLFGTAARVLPFEQLLRLTHAFMPWSKGQVEFDVHYDHCWPGAMETAFRDAGFKEVTVDVTWAQPGYFETIYPLFLLHAIYEKVVRALGMRKLAAYMVVRAVR